MIYDFFVVVYFERKDDYTYFFYKNIYTKRTWMILENVITVYFTYNSKLK